MFRLWRSFWSDESGQDLVEYAMLLALIALIVIGAVALLGQNIKTTFDMIAAAIPVGGGGGS
ncbi:MAG TPA: Flp family type IVb pilin [Gemmatimonadota bacterium]|nr:Flp family type IVb pilin [Gemmatimonadota bacterium]